MLSRKKIGFKIKMLRLEELTCTQKALAKTLGTSIESLKNWEKGTAKPNKNKLKKIAALAKTSYDIFINEWSEEQEKLLEIYTKNPMAKKELARSEYQMIVLEEIEEMSKKYIEENYNNYTYEKYLLDFPNSDPQGFQAYKEKEWLKLKSILDNYYDTSMFNFDVEVYERTGLRKVNYAKLLRDTKNKSKEIKKEMESNEYSLQKFLDNEL